MSEERQSDVDSILQALQEDVDPADFKLTLWQALESRKQRGAWAFFALLEVDDALFRGSDALLAREILLKAEDLAREIARARKVVAEARELEVGKT